VLHPEDGSVAQKDESLITQEELAGVDDSTADIFKFDGNSYWRAAVNVENEVFTVEWKPL
jgi:hypothetical protein